MVEQSRRSIAARLQEVADTLGNTKWSEAAFGPKGRTRLSAILTNLRKGQSTTLARDTARKLAAGATSLGYPLTEQWIYDEAGPGPFGTSTAAPARTVTAESYPSRSQAVVLLANVHPPEVLAALSSAVYSGLGDDPGIQYWIDEARRLRALLQREFKSIDPEENPEDDRPRATPADIAKVPARRGKSR